MQLLSSDSRTSRNPSGRDVFATATLSRSKSASSMTLNATGAPEVSGITGLCPENVLLGAARRKHFRNPREFLSRFAERQAAGFLRLIDRFPIVKRDWPYRPLRPEGSRRFAAGLVLRVEVRHVCEKGGNGCHAIGSVRSDDPSRPALYPTGDIDRKSVRCHFHAPVLVGNGAELLIKWNPFQRKSAVTDTANH